MFSARNASLAVVLFFPTLGILLTSVGDEVEPYRRSGFQPSHGFEQARLMPRGATPETGIVIGLRNIPASGPSRYFVVDATSEIVAIDATVERSWATTAGTFRVTQDASPEWVLDDIACDDEATTVDIPEATAHIRVEWGNVVSCQFVNKAPSTLFYSSFEDGTDAEWGAVPFDYCSESCGTTSPFGCSCDIASCVTVGDCCPDACLTCGPCS